MSDWLSTDCWACESDRTAALPADDFSGRLCHRMIVCTECGNKRCPKATDHRLDCSGSNDPNQPGSRHLFTPGPLPTIEELRARILGT